MDKDDVDERIKTLELAKDNLKEYMLIKMNDEDWHGVADAAMDLREIETELRVLEDL